MAAVITDIVSAMESEIALELGASYKKLAYLVDVQKNSFRTSNDRYGVRALESVQIPGVTRFTTYTQTFQVVLTKGYVQSNLDDTEQVESGLQLRESMLDIYTRLVNTKAGDPTSVLNVTDMVMDAPEYLEDDKVTVLRASMSISYRLNLN